MKKIVYLTLKVLLFCRCLNFCHDFFGHREKWLDRKAKVNFKIYDVTNWETNNYIDILPNISRSKDNQRMKFGQLIVYTMRNIFLEKSYTKCGGKTSPRPFSKISKSGISLDQKSEILHNLLLLYIQVEG